MGRDTRKKIFVGISGGVDSSVALSILKDQGHDVVGCFLKTWQPDFIECTWKEERRDAMRVCAKVGVPFLTLDLEQEYKEAVGMYMVREYAAGRTPNPDVMCNKEVKFGAFFRKARELGADAIATGHYARVSDGQLLRAFDSAKDQTYFLWTLTREILDHTLFPVGAMTKEEVRSYASEKGLLTATKKDSQGVCFLGQIDMKEFLQHFITTQKGNVLDEGGEIIGEHDGALLYTTGERHGFRILKKGTDDKRLYVIGRDLEQNTITVAPKQNLLKEESREITLEQIVWRMEPKPDTTYYARVRYQQSLEACRISGTTVAFNNPQVAASGQSVVVYEGDVCIGGGVIV